jgi:hypothetical protein
MVQHFLCLSALMHSPVFFEYIERTPNLVLSLLNLPWTLKSDELLLEIRLPLHLSQHKVLFFLQNWAYLHVRALLGQ